MLNDFLILADQVHKADTGYGGPLSTDGPCEERVNGVGIKCACLGCGANIGRLSMGGTESRPCSVSSSPEVRMGHYRRRARMLTEH